VRFSSTASWPIATCAPAGCSRSVGVWTSQTFDISQLTSSPTMHPKRTSATLCSPVQVFPPAPWTTRVRHAVLDRRAGARPDRLRPRSTASRNSPVKHLAFAVAAAFPLAVAGFQIHAGQDSGIVAVGESLVGDEIGEVRLEVLRCPQLRRRQFPVRVGYPSGPGAGIDAMALGDGERPGGWSQESGVRSDNAVFLRGFALLFAAGAALPGITRSSLEAQTITASHA
jgi:hypothetical protein